jgi:hypothetical protein
VGQLHRNNAQPSDQHSAELIGVTKESERYRVTSQREFDC